MDISAFRERNTSGAISVSELNGIIKNLIDGNRMLNSVTVIGEISNFKAHSSGHLYFSLKDEGGQVKAVMFRGSAQSLRFMPENGMRVIATGSVSVYSRDGSYQLYVSSMNPDGVGALYLAYEQLKARLSAEGLFDEIRKKPIPELPERVGVITSPTGAAVRDIINVITRRMPSTEIYLFPALVQGDGAEASLVSALDYFEAHRSVDVIIIGRGGGSIEDLWAFNGERLARKIADMSIPVISAVGHETDFTIVDFVSDLRAPTPSAAAEIAVPDIRELMMRISSDSERCDRALLRLVDIYRDRLLAIMESEAISSPVSIIEARYDLLGDLEDELRIALSQCIANAKSRFAVIAGKLGALNPISVLSRGYSLVYKDGVSVSNTENISEGDDITIRMSSGGLCATVTEVM